MRAALRSFLLDPSLAARRRRATSLSLVIAAHIIALILLFRPGGPLPLLPKSNPLIVELLPNPPVEKHAPKVKVAPIEHPRPGAAPRAPAPVPTPPKALNMLVMSSEEFAAADIGKMPSHQSAAAPGGGEGGSGGSVGTGVGSSPETAANAEWYVEPTHAELVTYLPRNIAFGSWGLIACRTIPDFHVEDCRELDESPSRSGLARALRQASWQFRVRPPRINGRTMIGAWVKIRFDFTKDGKD